MDRNRVTRLMYTDLNIICLKVIVCSFFPQKPKLPDNLQTPEKYLYWSEKRQNTVSLIYRHRPSLPLCIRMDGNWLQKIHNFSCFMSHVRCVIDENI